MGKMKDFATDIEGELYSDRDVEDLAEGFGCTVQHAKQNQLFIDLDSEEALSGFMLKYSMLQKLSDGILLKTYRTRKSRSGNTHAVVELYDDVSVEMQLGLQAALGSDPMRELLNFGRMLRTEDAGNCFFVPKVHKEDGVCQSLKEP